MAFAAEAAACGMRVAADASQASGTSSFFGRTLAAFPRTSLARVKASAARVTASAAAAGQAVQEKPKAAEASAGSTVKLATGLLDGKDPAWKLGTADKARLKAYYEAAVVPALKAEFGYTNPLEVPQIEKVVVNCGLGDASQSAKVRGLPSLNVPLQGSVCQSCSLAEAPLEARSSDNRGDDLLWTSRQRWSMREVLVFLMACCARSTRFTSVY